jgi:Na+-driven multidrug efflux pump
VNKNNSLAIASLLTAALVWGLIWFPYRALDAAGAGGALASFLTYFFALLPGLALLCGRRTQVAAPAGCLQQWRWRQGGAILPMSSPPSAAR